MTFNINFLSSSSYEILPTTDFVGIMENEGHMPKVQQRANYGWEKFNAAFHNLLQGLAYFNTEGLYCYKWYSVRWWLFEFDEPFGTNDASKEVQYSSRAVSLSPMVILHVVSVSIRRFTK